MKNGVQLQILSVLGVAHEEIITHSNVLLLILSKQKAFGMLEENSIRLYVENLRPFKECSVHLLLI